MKSSISMSNAMDTYLDNEGLIYSFLILRGGYDGLGTTESLPKKNQTNVLVSI